MTNQTKRFYKYSLFVLIIRVAGYFLILWRPIEGVLLAMLLDILDYYVFAFGRFTLNEYHQMDKPIDYIQYFFMIPPILDSPLLLPYLLMVWWRSMGMFVYEILKQKSWIFMIFPNMAEYVFLTHFMIEAFDIDANALDWRILLAIFLFKMYQEWLINRDKPSDKIMEDNFMYKFRLWLGFSRLTERAEAQVNDK